MIKDFNERFYKEPLYLKYEFENAVLRTDPKSDKDKVRIFLKFKGKKEFETDTATNKVATEALLERSEITAKEYTAF